MFSEINANMQIYGRILVLICIFLCLTLNYTFPLHREISDTIPLGKYANQNYFCKDYDNTTIDKRQRIRKSLLSLRGNKKTKHSAQEKISNSSTGPKPDLNKNAINNVDLRQYEQLVIMKKYPYLDIKELEMKYRPSGKSVRHSLPVDSGLEVDNDPSICEQNEEMLNVEINNRGLSGFAIPTQMKQGVEDKQNLKLSEFGLPNYEQKASAQNALENLKQDIFSYLEAKDNN